MATPVIMPRQGQSVESCILVDWLVAPGATVKMGQPVASIETDKAVFEIESPADGTLLEMFFKKGDDIPVLTTIAVVGAPGEDVSNLRPLGASASPKSEVDGGLAPSPDGSGGAGRTPSPNRRPEAGDHLTPPSAPASSPGVSPRARKLAAAHGIDPALLSGTGPGGRVIARDAQAAADAAHLSPSARARLAAGGDLSAPARGSGPGGMVLQADLIVSGGARVTAPVPPPSPDLAGRTEIPLTGIRKIIAERMRTSLATTAQLTLFRGFDATAVLACRQQIKNDGEQRGMSNVTLNDMIVHAVARALVKHPELNAHFLGNRIARFSAVNIGVATDTPRGLMVPVLRDAHTLALGDLSRQLKPILAAAQAGTISPDLLRGGTFTITNMGMLGVEQFTPILNAPEVAILGVGGLTLKPIMRDGQVRHVQSIALSLTLDHQAVDGAPGARFLQELVMLLENFALG